MTFEFVPTPRQSLFDKNATYLVVRTSRDEASSFRTSLPPDPTVHRYNHSFIDEAALELEVLGDLIRQLREADKGEYDNRLWFRPTVTIEGENGTYALSQPQWAAIRGLAPGE